MKKNAQQIAYRSIYCILQYRVSDALGMYCVSLEGKKETRNMEVTLLYIEYGAP